MTKPKPGSSREYERKRMQRIKADPKLYAAYLAKKSKRNAAYYANLKSDPERYDAIMQRQEERNKLRFGALKQDPERYEEWLQKARKAAQARHARRKAERGKL